LVRIENEENETTAVAGHHTLSIAYDEPWRVRFFTLQQTMSKGKGMKGEMGPGQTN
jgi:hypothetical protein